MIITKENINRNFNTIGVKPFWNNSDEKELKMHKIHAYPAKFPSLMVSKSLEYANSKNITVNSISDIFCGCGTTALEAKRNNLDFWGCDINPVATLIASVKSKQYQEKILIKHFNNVLAHFEDTVDTIVDEDIRNNERISYWFHSNQINELNRLLNAIILSVPKGKYQDFFLVAFSNILKKTSKWLMKSIKPQIDPDKPIYDVKTVFGTQFEVMKKANKEAKKAFSSTSSNSILTKNFLEYKIRESFVDMVVTSPPYVTSYEYADLHQLSTLWLKYTDDYRKFREGTIGSLYHEKSSLQNEIDELPEIGRSIHERMKVVDKRKAKSVVRYFVDMNKVVKKTYQMINPGGIAVFVIGNTKYKNVEINNAKYLSNCMLNHGFAEIDVAKRKISSKNLSPYRNKTGQFSSNPKHKKVYSHEFVLIGKK